TTLDSPWLAYVVNCGRQDNVLAGSAPPVTPSSPFSASQFAAAEKPGNGVFFNQFNLPADFQTGNPRRSRFMRLSMPIGRIPDGSGNTLMLSENTAAFKYTYWDSPDQARMVTNDAVHQFKTATDAECATGMVWDPKALTSATAPPSSPAEKINGTDKNF